MLVYQRRNSMLSEKKVAEVLWTVRILRLESLELTAQKVYERQQHLFRYSQEDVNVALDEIGKRGYHWSQRYSGISDACIVWSKPNLLASPWEEGV
jgi:hypothetical protein